MRSEECGVRNEESGYGYRIEDAVAGDEGLWDRCPSVPVEILNKGSEVKTNCGSGSGQRVPVEILNEGEEVKIHLRIRFGTAGPGLICPDRIR